MSIPVLYFQALSIYVWKYRTLNSLSACKQKKDYDRHIKKNTNHR